MNKLFIENFFLCDYEKSKLRLSFDDVLFGILEMLLMIIVCINNFDYWC